MSNACHPWRLVLEQLTSVKVHKTPVLSYLYTGPSMGWTERNGIFVIPSPKALRGHYMFMLQKCFSCLLTSLKPQHKST